MGQGRREASISNLCLPCPDLYCLATVLRAPSVRTTRPERKHPTLLQAPRRNADRMKGGGEHLPLLSGKERHCLESGKRRSGAVRARSSPRQNTRITRVPHAPQAWRTRWVSGTATRKVSGQP